MRANFKKFDENTTTRPYYNTFQCNFDPATLGTTVDPFNCGITGLFTN